MLAAMEVDIAAEIATGSSDLIAAVAVLLMVLLKMCLASLSGSGGCEAHQYL